MICEENGQLLLPFCEIDPIQLLSNKVKTLEGRHDGVRKSVHAKTGEVKKHVMELEARLQIIERAICSGIKEGLKF